MQPLCLLTAALKVRVDNQTATFVQIFTVMIVLLPFVMIDGNILTIVRLDAAAVSSIRERQTVHTFIGNHSHWL